MERLYRLEYDHGNGMPSYHTATLSDLKAALAEHGMVAVPLEPNKKDLLRMSMAAVDKLGPLSNAYGAIYKAMIQAAQEKLPDKG